MSADLEGGKFIGCGKLFVPSGIFKIPTASGISSSVPPSRGAERVVSSDSPPLPEAGSAIATGATRSPNGVSFESVVSGVGLTASRAGCIGAAGINRKTGSRTRSESDHESAEGCLSLVKPEGSHSRAATSGPETGERATDGF
jgi:hypothetical protein